MTENPLLRQGRLRAQSENGRVNSPENQAQEDVAAYINSLVEMTKCISRPAVLQGRLLAKLEERPDCIDLALKTPEIQEHLDEQEVFSLAASNAKACKAIIESAFFKGMGEKAQAKLMTIKQTHSNLRHCC